MNEGLHFDTLFYGQLTTFLTLMAAFWYLGRKPMRAFLQARKERMSNELVEAAAQKKAASEKFQRYSERLEKLDHEAASIRAEMIKAGEDERDRIVAEAESKASRMRKDTQFFIDQQIRQLAVDLRKEAADSVTQTAEQILARDTTDADQTRLAEDFLRRLEEEAEQRRKPRSRSTEQPPAWGASV